MSPNIEPYKGLAPRFGEEAFLYFGAPPAQAVAERLRNSAAYYVGLQRSYRDA